MTQKNQFLAFVHKHIEEFTPQQMEAAIRLLNGKEQPSARAQADQSREHNLQKAERAKTMGQRAVISPMLKDQIQFNISTPIFDVDAMNKAASNATATLSKLSTITYSNGA